MAKSSKGKLRFAALIRVSTEKQAEKGESLRTQKADLPRCIGQMGGTVAKWYGGQEHATPGWEKQELERLLSDAKKGLFDAVIVNHADRWSRDNAQSKRGLEIFRNNGIRFFVGTFEYDLFNPQHRFYLGMSAEIGELHASTQKQKSLENRIARAKRGLPVCGKLPFGRTFDKKTEKWGIDPKKHAMVQDVARRYLAGENMGDLALEYGVNYSNLHKTMMKRCGPIWMQEFTSTDLNIKEVVPTTVPELLPAKTIAALHRRSKMNKTFEHGHAKRTYLFGGYVFCAHCGYGMFGQTNHGERRYYRHAHTARVRECPYPAAWVRAEELEQVIFRQLFECFGNPTAVQRAIEQATPNLEKAREYQERMTQLETDLAQVAAAREKILRLVSRELVTEDQAEKELTDLQQRENRKRKELTGLQERFGHLPTTGAIKDLAQQFSTKFRKYTDARLVSKVRHANHALDEMTTEEKRTLIKAVFEGTQLDGKPMGIYIQWIDGEASRRNKRWKYSLHGNLIEEQGHLPIASEDLESRFVFGAVDARPDTGLDHDGSACRARGLLARRFRGRSVRLPA